jgi:hypothetical protein
MSGHIQGLDELKRVYQHADPDSIGLFLGAGVNLFPPEWRGTRKKCYETYSWRQLLEALYEKNKERLGDESFATLWDRCKDDWPGLAEKLVGSLGIGLFVDQMDKIIHNAIPRKDKYARLSKLLLDQAPTLRAAICFSAAIRERTESSWTFKRNPRIGTVITPNYDFFFGAGWTRYQAFSEHWKVQTPFSDDKPDPEQRTISYIHGYVPYRFSKKKELVLTRESYRKYYAPDRFAPHALREATKTYSLIFLGTSFSDQPLQDMLRDYPGPRQHFAIVKSDSEADERVRQLAICPIPVQNYSEIAAVLEDVYRSALDPDECRRVGLEGPEHYWKRLVAGPKKRRKKE